MSKTNEQILSKVPNLTFSEIENCDLYTESQALIAMTAAREDERERIRMMIQNRIYELRFIIDHDQFKSPYYGEMLITELKKLIPCT
jgi:hypothetical protein